MVFPTETVYVKMCKCSNELIETRVRGIRKRRAISIKKIEIHRSPLHLYKKNRQLLF